MFLDPPSFDTTSAMGRVYPQPVPLTEDQAARYDELADKWEAQAQTDEEEAELEALYDAKNRDAYTAEQMQQAGVIVTITYHGDLDCRRGFVREADTLLAVEAGVLTTPRTIAPGSAQQVEAPRYPKALTEDMNAIRTCAAQTALLDKPELALDLLTFALTQPAYAGAGVIDIRAEHPANAVATDEGLILSERLEPCHKDWLRRDTAADAFAAFRDQPKKTRNAILTEAIARMLSVPMDGQANPLAKMVADLTKPDLRKVWTPTASFLKRLKAADLDAIMLHIDGVALGSTFASMKKGQKVERLAAIFAGGANAPALTRAQRARVDAWVPDEMNPQVEELEAIDPGEDTPEAAITAFAIAAE